MRQFDTKSILASHKNLEWARTRYLLRGMARLLWCGAGAATALGLVLWYVNPPSDPLLIASFGGSTVFLFALTRAPAAQPRSLIGGHLGGALIGIICFHAFGDATWVYVLAVVLTLVFMLGTQTVHPPAGANPLLMIHGHAGISAFFQPLALGILILGLVAAAWSRLMPGTVRYPHNWGEKSPPSFSWESWVE